VRNDDEGASRQSRAAQASDGAADDEGRAGRSQGANQRAEFKNADGDEEGELDGKV
jgi:hypothetical protein